MSNTIEALREAWYVIAQQAEVTDRPFRRTLLGESVVLWRAPDGSPRAAANGCPHRLAPLHLGRSVAGTLECPYHGLRFDESGHCVFNPHGKGAVPSGARLRLYPTARHAGWVWVWMGALPPDAAALPQIEFLVPSAQRRWVSGCISVRANYRHVIDNAMDPAHIGTVHRESLHSEGLAKARPKVSREAGGSVCRHLGRSIALLAFDEGVVTVRKALDTRIAAERNCTHFKAECDAARSMP